MLESLHRHRLCPDKQCTGNTSCKYYPTVTDISARVDRAASLVSIENSHAPFEGLLKDVLLIAHIRGYEVPEILNMWLKNQEEIVNYYEALNA